MNPLIMAVLNATPDSFSDGGLALDPAAAEARAIELIRQGADVIDVGGESTRPGADVVSDEEELHRVLPVLERVLPLARSAAVRVSIDTRHPAIARAAVGRGVDLINDVSGELGMLAAELAVGWICTHMAGIPADFATPGHFDDVVGEVLNSLVTKAHAAVKAGCPEVFIDPGIGFGKGLTDNVELLAHLDQFVATGLPVVIGTSRKSSMGALTAQSDSRVGIPQRNAMAAVDDRREASLATATWAMTQGVAMIRVHDVAAHMHARAVVCGEITNASGPDSRPFLQPSPQPSTHQAA